MQRESKKVKDMQEDYYWIILKLLGSLGLLIFGMRMMSDALQKMAGSQLRHILGAMTTNRFTGMLTGTFVTCAVQSSSATTVMTVSFVSAGLMTLSQAISVIMGANIGTTLTAWIMSLGYNVDLTNVDGLCNKTHPGKNGKQKSLCAQTTGGYHHLSLLVHFNLKKATYTAMRQGLIALQI